MKFELWMIAPSARSSDRLRRVPPIALRRREGQLTRGERSLSLAAGPFAHAPFLTLRAPLVSVAPSDVARIAEAQ
jgi:hypothetical protein